jgi:hypothetical protein|tara:strand:- start:1305 stop:1508 length:204 start_codon:yes stop_codon:yes gene_type:complete
MCVATLLNEMNKNDNIKTNKGILFRELDVIFKLFFTAELSKYSFIIDPFVLQRQPKVAQSCMALGIA